MDFVVECMDCHYKKYFINHAESALTLMSNLPCAKCESYNVNVSHLSEEDGDYIRTNFKHKLSIFTFEESLTQLRDRPSRWIHSSESMDPEV